MENEKHAGMEAEEASDRTEKSAEEDPSGREKDSSRRGKIGPNGYNNTVKAIREDLDRFETEHQKLREDVRKTLALLESLLPSRPGDLTAFVDRGLAHSSQETDPFPDRKLLARTWEEGKRTVEELDAFFGKLRTQKIWSQEDLEGILSKLDVRAGEIAQAVETVRELLDKLPNSLSPESAGLRDSETSRLLLEISALSDRIVETRSAVLGSIEDRIVHSSSGSSGPEWGLGNVSPILERIGEIKAILEKTADRPERATVQPEPEKKVATDRRSLFSKEADGKENKPRKAVPPRLRTVGLWGALGLLAILAIVARIRHAGPPVSPPASVSLPSPAPKTPEDFRVPAKGLRENPAPTTDLAPLLSGLDTLHEGETENGQAIRALSERIDRALAKLPKKPILSGRETQLENEGREFEWLIKTWPKDPGRGELLRMMGTYAGE